jgi:uncharacterized protein YabN with tetrapyrrole methylase and pyrophosphatase domain
MNKEDGILHIGELVRSVCKKRKRNHPHHRDNI